MNEVLPQKLIVETNQQYHAFCQLESLVHLETLVLHLYDLNRCELITKRFNQAKLETIALKYIEMRFINWHIEYEAIIEAIGRLPCSVIIVVGYLPPFDLNYGNIVGVYCLFGGTTNFQVRTWMKYLYKTRIRKIGTWNGYMIKDFKDDLDVAVEILENPDNLMHSLETYYPEHKGLLRQQVQSHLARQESCVRFALCSKRMGVPRDIMRLIVSHLSPTDWEAVLHIPKKYKWVEDTLKTYVRMLDANTEAIKNFGLADRASTPDEYRIFKYWQGIYEKQIEEYKQELREIQKRWTTNKFGLRVIGPRKKLKV